MRQGESDLCRCVIPVFHPRWPPANWLGSDWGGPHRLPRGGQALHTRQNPHTRTLAATNTALTGAVTLAHFVQSPYTQLHTAHHIIIAPRCQSSSTSLAGPSHRHRAMLGPAFPPHVMQPSFVLLCFHCSRRCGEPHGRRVVSPRALCVEVRIVRGVPDVGSR